MKKNLRSDESKEVSELKKKFDAIANQPLGGLIFQKIRNEKKWSQRELSQKMLVSRSHLQRLEEKEWSNITLGEVVCFADAVAYPVRRLLSLVGLGPLKKMEFARCSQAQPFSIVSYDAGVCLYYFIDAPENYHLGMLQIDPQKTLQGQRLPKANFLWGFINRGNLCLTLEGEEMIFKEREVFHLDPTLNFDLYNPHPLNSLDMLIFLKTGLGE